MCPSPYRVELKNQANEGFNNASCKQLNIGICCCKRAAEALTLWAVDKPCYTQGVPRHVLHT